MLYVMLNIYVKCFVKFQTFSFLAYLGAVKSKSKVTTSVSAVKGQRLKGRKLITILLILIYQRQVWGGDV